MSKKKKKWFSAQALVEEMGQLSLDELEAFEETRTGTPIQEAIDRPLVSDTQPTQEEAHKAAETADVFEKEAARKRVEEQSEMNKEKQHTRETAQETNEESVEAPARLADTEAEKKELEKTEGETSMADKQGKNEQDKETTIEQLTFEINELLVENERLVTLQEKAAKKQEEQVQQLTVANGTAQERIQALEMQAKTTGEEIRKTVVHRMEQQAAAEKETYEQQLAQQARQFEQDLAKKEVLLAQLTKQLTENEQLLKNQQKNEVSEEASALQATIEALREENEALKTENEQFQTEISEVLVFARRKANRTIQEAKIESDRMIRTTEMRIDGIHDRAKEILFEVAEAKVSVVGLFDDLHHQVNQLSDKKLLFETLDN